MQPGPLYPLRFVPIFRRYLWGGRALHEVLGKPLPPGNDYAESWEVVDRGTDQSAVANGPLQGATLGELLARRGRELLGRHAPLPRFPLLLKFLDAQAPLSLQVHPRAEQAAKLDPPDLPKTEAWVILQSQPGSYLYAGLKRGFDRDALAREVARNTPHLAMQRFEPQAGECYFLPAGTPHALGPGLLVAEIQQSSDATLRLFDWNRLGPDGKPRPLHVEAGLAAIDYEASPANPQRPVVAAPNGGERLVASDAFVLDRFQSSDAQQLPQDDRCHILAVLSGEVDIAGDPAGEALTAGGVVLVPASSRPGSVAPRAPSVWLDMYLP